MKRGVKLGISIVLTLLITGYFYYTFPRKVNRTYNGMKYKIADSQQQENIKVTLSGYYYKRLFSKDYFEGTIIINYESYPRLKLFVGEQLQMVSYRDYEGDGAIHTFGEAFIGENLDTLTICIQDGQTTWTSRDGFMVSVPAKNRVEALEISNRLLNGALKNKLELK